MQGGKMKYKYSNGNGYTSKLNQSDYTDIYSNSKKVASNNGYVDIYSSEKKKDKRKNRKKIPWTKIFSLISFISLGIIGCLMLYAYKTLHSFNYDNITTTESQDNLANDSMVLNVLLIGSDSMSVGDGGRSDSMILVSLDARHKKIKLTSLMRDIWVTIPGYGQDRLNASYAFGGPSLTIDTIGKNFGILIDRYAVVDFEGFAKIIDILDGIDLNLTADECAYINKYSEDPNTLRGSGMKHLTGLQALHYSRDRNSIGSDYDRTSRQRNLLKAVVTKMKTANIAQITELIAKIGPLVTTNFKSSEISRMATHSMTYLKYDVEEFRLPTDDNVRNETYSGKMVLVINNTAKAKQDIYNFIYETEPNSRPDIPNDTFDNPPVPKSSSEKSTNQQPKSSVQNTSTTDKTNQSKTANVPTTTNNSNKSTANNKEEKNIDSYTAGESANDAIGTSQKITVNSSKSDDTGNSPSPAKTSPQAD